MAYVIIFLTAFLFYFALRQYRFYLYRKYELRLFVLRDKLREYAIEKKINKNDWTFQYFDSSMSKMITTFKLINLYYAVLLFKSYDDNPRFVEFKRHLNLALDKNPNLQEINNEYSKIIVEYILNKHILLIIITSLGIGSALRSIGMLKKYISEAKESVKNLTTFPETSTSMEFSNRGHVHALVKC